MAKSLFLTYLFWLIGGIFGLHHFYLQRDRHAFIWWISVGGYFGLGWIRDLWRIPKYVKDANEDVDYIEELTEKMRKQSTPVSSSARLFGQVMIADALGYLIQGAFPTEYLTQYQITLLSAFLVPLAAAIELYASEQSRQCRDNPETICSFSTQLIWWELKHPLLPTYDSNTCLFWTHVRVCSKGLCLLTCCLDIKDSIISTTALSTNNGVSTGVHLVGNVGRHQGSLLIALLGAYLTIPLYFFIPNSVVWTSLASSTLFNKYGKKWRRTPKRKHSLVWRITILSLCGLLYISLWGSWFYFSCSMTDRNQEDIKCRDAARHFFKSPIWMEFKTVMRDLYIYARYHGWRDLWQQLLQSFDPKGEANAFKVLDLGPNASQGEITTRYRQLSRQWHPDRFSDPQAKYDAQETFISIQQAYAILSDTKSQRLSLNQKDRENP
ncbi:DNAJC22 [Cordylochernes scorpioides]|uniref:DnaJ homolog subfamily C member 22 n=1 Tax=Cordylochernes scorpioides TaxID=51811 RepID=A0ABY6L357_9ARAC|nr:DNAJC22 [Cordylochernes scorpioides]